MNSRNQILLTLRKHKQDLNTLGIKRIGLFGSFLNGTQTEQSDLDILLDFEPDKESYDNFLAACELLEQIFGSRKVDVVTRNGLSPYIGPKILNQVHYA